MVANHIMPTTTRSFGPTLVILLLLSSMVGPVTCKDAHVKTNVDITKRRPTRTSKTAHGATGEPTTGAAVITTSIKEDGNGRLETETRSSNASQLDDDQELELIVKSLAEDLSNTIVDRRHGHDPVRPGSLAGAAQSALISSSAAGMDDGTC